MKKKILSTVALLHFLCIAFSQQTLISNLSVANVPDSLKKDANAVSRLDEAVLEVSSPSKYNLKVHEITTVLNAQASRYLQQSLQIDKFNNVTDVEVKLYDSTGRELQRFRKKDFSVENYYDGMSLVTDNKIMRLHLTAPDYPCTVDLKYETNATSYIELPTWYLGNVSTSVERFKYVVKVPLDLDVRHRTLNMKLDPVSEVRGKQKVYTWEATAVPVNKMEKDGYETGHYLPQVQVSPKVFEYDGYPGYFSTWQDFGKWNYALYEEKDPFSEQRLAEIKALIADKTDVKAKIKVLYEYLQKNMRYVSIQLGIGGFKPFAARFVDEKKYGDCKALSNYMRNLLAVAGIKSYPALINAGYNEAPASPEFPKDVFNHVILCVPQAKDSIWLECTSNNNEAGFLGTFTENKNALLLTEKGGVLVQTPRSNYSDNLLETVNDVFVNDEGAAQINSHINATGSFFELLHAINEMEGREQTELFVRYLDYKEPDEFHPAREPGSDEHKMNLKFSYSKLFDFKAGDKFFFPRSIRKLCDVKLDLLKERKVEYIFKYPYKKVDSTMFHLPASFKVDDLPKGEVLSDGPVYYKKDVAYNAASNTITFVTTLMLKNNIIAPSDYKMVSEIFDKIDKEEANKLILKK
jgi:hypothetical protein